MSSNRDSKGVHDLLSFLVENGKSGTSYSKLEKKFKITSYKTKGNRAKKIWYGYINSKLTIDQYIDKLFGLGNFQPKPKPKHTLKRSLNLVKTEWEYKNNGESAYFNGTTESVITSLDDAIKFSKVDLDTWEVKDYKFKSWDVTMKMKRAVEVDGQMTHEYYDKKRTNYGVQVWFVKRVNDDEVYSDLMETLNRAMKTNKVKKVNGSGIGVVNMADFHLGAEVTNLITTPDFNLDILVDHLSNAAAVINKHKYAEVYVNMLGDYFESISGLNHLNTFKSLMKGGYGANAIILAGKVLSNFLSKINNLVEVNMVSGNHDRVTIQKQVDNEGAAAELLAYILKEKMVDVKFNYHTYCLTREIDGIGYILTHGHFSMNKKPTANIIHKFGVYGKFNLWLEGHYHTRKSEISWMKKPIIYEKFVIVSLDESLYRKLTIPSIFTGNFYSETLGYSTGGGFVIIENNGFGKPNVFDYSL